ncbi:FAD-dependent oxidoreductase [Salsuginibacillus kocurii]|uniref:FAD-dependent oxidoreductase n=1 Tax=Salsuginibacillus kocurii TaxID=427078 RepID=UPI00035F0CFF|nr:FAD-dependent oxidoreductase [Salsuginibacillus kocurii]
MSGKTGDDYMQATDVLIVGAGPTGLTLANELKRQGIDALVIEKKPSLSSTSKALGMMARSLELFQKLGISAELITTGLKAKGAHAYSEGKKLAHITFGDELETPFPYVLMIPQQDTERVLYHHFQQQAGKVCWEHTLLALQQHEGHVDAVIQNAEGQEETWQVKWLIACDGAHSTVRKQMDISFAGTAFKQTFALADVKLQGEVPQDEIMAHVNRGNVIAFFPMPTKEHRIMMSREGLKEEGDVSETELQQMIEEIGIQARLAAAPSWTSRFHVHQRKVDKSVHQRVILAGDAAHIHSPLGAQGMNTGIQDAFNLGWKLSLVVKGDAETGLLDSYEAERQPIWEELLSLTERATQMVLTRRSALVGLRRVAGPILAKNSRVRTRALRTLAQIGIHYPNSPIHTQQTKHSNSPASGARAPDAKLYTHTGEKIPLFEQLRDPRHTLIVYTKDEERIGKVTERLRDYQDTFYLLPVLAANKVGETNAALYDIEEDFARSYQVKGEALFVVRPDGYLSVREDSLHPVYLLDYFRGIYNT